MALCAQAKEEELARAAAAGGDTGAIDFLRAPEVGLVMVRGRTGGDGDAFNLGEMTVTRCVIRLENGIEGYGYVQGRSASRARDAAIIDALARTPAMAGRIEAALGPIRERIAAELRDAERRTAATRVNFFTMIRGED